MRVLTSSGLLALAIASGAAQAQDVNTVPPNGTDGAISPADAAAAGRAPTSQPAPTDAGVVSGLRSTTPSATSTPPATPSNQGLSEIVVTAQRRAENLQKAAIAVTAVSAAALQRANITDTTQLTKIAPSLQISNVGGSASAFYLRGVGNFTTISTNDSAVSFNVDGVPFARTQSAQAVFYDLDRVEVLKGPQGTLYGRNSTGGAINIITTKPIIGQFGGYGTFEYGNYDAKKATGAINLPFGDRGAVRVAGYLSDHDGYYSDGTSDDKTRAIRVQIATRPTEGFKLTVGTDYAYQGGVGAGVTLRGLDLNDRIGISDPRAGALLSTAFSGLAGSFLHPLANDAYQRNKYFGIYAQADIDTPVGTITIIPAYRDTKTLFHNFAAGFEFNERLSDQQASVEARLASDTSHRFEYILGFFYLNERASEPAAFNQQYFGAFTNALEGKTASYAGFARLTYKITDRLRLTGGVRYTVDDKSAFIDSSSAVVVCPAVFAGGTCLNTPSLPGGFVTPPSFLVPPGTTSVIPWGTSGAIAILGRPVVDAAKVFKKATYRVAAEYDVAPTSLLYAAYETGFKAGGFFNSIDNPVFKPETIDAITVGSKNRFFGNKLQLNLEGFYWNYKDQQVSHFRLNSQGGTEFVTENIGKTRIWGVEAEMRARVLDNTSLSGTVQYLNATNKNFRYRSPTLLGTPVTGCPSSLDGSAYVVDCSGRTPLNAPRWTIAGGIEQIVDLGSAGKVTLNADTRFQTLSYTGFDLLPTQRQKAYATLDLQGTYALPGSHLTIAGFANNVTNKQIVAFSQPHPRSADLLTNSLRPPRTYGVRVGYKF